MDNHLVRWFPIVTCTEFVKLIEIDQKSIKHPFSGPDIISSGLAQEVKVTTNHRWEGRGLQQS